MCRPKIKPEPQMVVRLTAAILLAAALGGCSEIYFDRRDTVAFGGGDAVATDTMMQMNDPWPPHSGDTQLAASGQRMQTAIERYRSNVVTQPVDPMLLQVTNQTPATAQTSSPSNTPLPTPSISPGTTTTTTTVVSAPPSPGQ